MRIDTTSGLHGTLVGYISTNALGTEGVALVLRDSFPYPERAFSTHRVYSMLNGALVAEGGHYDLTLEEAREDLRQRAGWFMDGAA